MDPVAQQHQQAFLAAVRSGDVEAVRSLIESFQSSSSGSESGDWVRAQTEARETALHLAAEANSEEMIRLLIPFYDYDSAVLRSRLDLDAFHIAAKNGYIGIVKQVLSHWPDVCKVCDSSNTSPLYSAAYNNHVEVVNTILDVDESAVRIVRKNGKTALHMAARNGHYVVVRALVRRDPGVVPIMDKKGQTALHMAVKGRNPDVVEELLMADVSTLNLRDKKGNTALHMATRKWRLEMVRLLLSYENLEINAINNHNETAMDLAEKVPYGESKMEIIDSLLEVGGRHARDVGKVDENSELRQTVSDIKDGLHEQIIQNAKTNKRVTSIAKDLRKLRRDALQNTINSVTMVAVLIASIAFMAILYLPGQYYQDRQNAGKAYIVGFTGFKVFCLLNATALFISLAVVVIQVTFVVWQTGAQELLISIVNKLMWSACLCTCTAFISLAYVVVGRDVWMAGTATAIGGPIMIGTLLILAYFVLRQRFNLCEDKERTIRRGSGSKSLSLSRHSGLSDLEADSDREKKIYAL